jgi:hypothetical protein
MEVRILLSLALGSSLILGCSLVPNVGEILSEVSVTGSGNVITREFDLSGFDQVEVSGAFVASITRGDSFSVVVRVDERLEQHLRVQAVGRTLQVGLAPNLSILGTATREVEITMPQLAGLEFSGASQGTISGFDSTDPLRVELSGASKLGGDIQAGDASFEVSGASTADLSGSGTGLTLNVSGASTADLSGFAVDDANVEASGASSATVNVSGRLDAEASGASHVEYIGNPTLGRIEATGASTIEAG